MTRWRLLSHPVAWAVPLVVLMAIAAHAFNDGYYEQLVNSDPQGDVQLHEWYRTTLIFRYTTGLLAGQLIALVVGAALATRHRLWVALAIAVPLSAAAAGAVFVTGQLMGPVGQQVHISYVPLDDPVFVRVMVRELAAYPLYAWAGVGIGSLLRDRIQWVFLLVPAWAVATFAGLVQKGEGAAPHWLYWAVPPIGGGTAVSLAGKSMGDTPVGPVLFGDWGARSSLWQLLGAAGWAALWVALAVFVKPAADRVPEAEPAHSGR
jgi:hypothetical protein